MDAATRQLIEALHNTPTRCVLALTGGGTGAAAALLGVPGASRTILEVVVPYHEQALTEFLGRRPEQFCSADTARAMALRAYQRAEWLTPGEPVVGLGCTATLATDRPKRGDHRFFLTVHGPFAERTCSLTLTKGQRDRRGEEAVLDAVLLNTLAEVCGAAERLPVALLPGEQIQVEERPLDPFLGFFQGRAECVCVDADGRRRVDVPRPRVLVAGSFNPLHHGHWGLAEAAAELTAAPAAFELCVANVDKPPLTAEEVMQRLRQFAWRAPVWLTRAPTFVEKARLFPEAVFVLGSDTAARVLLPRYYAQGEVGLAEALAELRRLGCRFLVAGRLDGVGSYLGLEHLPVPAEFADLFAAIPRQRFQVDVSSTELRGQGGTPRTA